MTPSAKPWKSMMLTGDSGTGLKPLSGELATVPIEAMAPVNVVAALVLHKAILYLTFCPIT